VQRSDLALENNDNIQPGVLGRLAFRARAPSDDSPVVKGLGFAMGCVDKSGMTRT
jgi:hypothetical protein